MYWSVEGFVLIATGALFLVAVGVSFLPRFELTAMSRVAFAIGAMVLIGCAVTLAYVEGVFYPPPVYLLPVVPVLIIGVLVRDAIAWTPESAPAQRGTASIAGYTDEPSRSAFFPPAEIFPAAGEGGSGSARTRAGSTDATAAELAEIAYSHPELRPCVASNPATPSNVLEWLASQGDPVVHAAINARMADAHAH